MPHTKGSTTTYFNEEVMTQGARRREEATMLLQQRLDTRVERARFGNIRVSPTKTELMHLIPVASKKRWDKEAIDIHLYNVTITPQPVIKVS